MRKQLKTLPREHADVAYWIEPCGSVLSNKSNWSCVKFYQEKSDLVRALPGEPRKSLPYSFFEYDLHKPAVVDAYLGQTTTKYQYRCPKFGLMLRRSAKGPFGMLTMKYGSSDVIWDNSSADDLSVLKTATSSDYAVRANLINDVINQARDVRLNLAVELAEIPETVLMLRNVFKTHVTTLKGSLRSLVFATSAFTRGNERRAAKLLGLNPSGFKRRNAKIVAKDLNSIGTYTADRWLEFKYGWMPLVYTAQDAISELQRLVDDKPVVKFYAGSKRGVSRAFTKTLQGALPEGGFGDAYMTGTTHEKVGMTFEVTDLPAGVYLGFDNLKQVAWEMTPWSFMIDPFFNVAGYLGALEGVKGLKFVDGYHTSFHRSVLDIRPRLGSSPQAGFIPVYQRRSTGQARVVNFKRTVLTSPSAQFPGLNFGDLDAEYFGTLAALFKSSFFR